MMANYLGKRVEFLDQDDAALVVFKFSYMQLKVVSDYTHLVYEMHKGY